MEKGRSLKVMVVVALCVAILGISVAFAAMNQVLNINGTASLDPALWKIKFANVTLKEYGTGEFTTDPTISDTTIQPFAVKLTKPGDAVAIEFTVINEGDVDAILTTLSKNSPVCAVNGETDHEDAILVCGKLTYTLQYAEGNDVVEKVDGSVLNSKTTATNSKDMVLTLTFLDSADKLPTNSVDITNLNISLTYSQVMN